MKGSEMETRYGDNNTIHRTGHLDIEVADGHVVAVWFRCMPLRFKESLAEPLRAIDMRRMYEDNKPDSITAIITVPHEP